MSDYEICYIDQKESFMGRSKKISRLDCGQYLLSSLTSFTQTNYGERTDEHSHDTLNRWMKKHKACSNHVWEYVKDDIEVSENGYLVFDDTVLDENPSKNIEIA